MDSQKKRAMRDFWSPFAEKVILLLLSGILIPIVMMFINGQIENRQMRLQTQQIQEASLQDAKQALREDIAQTFLTYETVALDVSWFGSKLPENEERFRRAYERYNRETVTLIAQMRVQIAKLEALSSKSTADELFFFSWEEVLENQDIAIVALEAKAASTEEWNEQHEQNQRSLIKANTLITTLAREMDLVTGEPSE